RGRRFPHWALGIPPTGALLSSRHRRLLPSDLLGECGGESTEVPAADGGGHHEDPAGAPQSTATELPPAYAQLLAERSIATGFPRRSIGPTPARGPQPRDRSERRNRRGSAPRGLEMVSAPRFCRRAPGRGWSPKRTPRPDPGSLWRRPPVSPESGAARGWRVERWLPADGTRRPG